MACFLEDCYLGYNGMFFDGELDFLAFFFGNIIFIGFYFVAEYCLEINFFGQDLFGFYIMIFFFGGVLIMDIFDMDYGVMFNYIQIISKSVNVYVFWILDIFNNGINLVDYFNSFFGNQFKIIVWMMVGGSCIKIYMASKGGWDNYNNMVQYNNNIEGIYVNFFGDLSEFVVVFQEDI